MHLLLGTGQIQLVYHELTMFKTIFKPLFVHRLHVCVQHSTSQMVEDYGDSSIAIQAVFHADAHQYWPSLEIPNYAGIITLRTTRNRPDIHAKYLSFSAGQTAYVPNDVLHSSLIGKPFKWLCIYHHSLYIILVFRCSAFLKNYPPPANRKEIMTASIYCSQLQWIVQVQGNLI